MIVRQINFSPVCINNFDFRDKKHPLNVHTQTDIGRFHHLAIIVIVATLSSIIIMCIAVISLRIFRDQRAMRELKAAGLQHFEEGDVDSINPNLPLGEQADLLPYDSKYEFPKEQLELGNVLGSGAFGVVYEAIAKKIVPGEYESTVAVKMIKQNYDNEVWIGLEFMHSTVISI